MIKSIPKEEAIEGDKNHFIKFTTDLRNTNIRYVKIKAQNIGVCPNGHPSAGGKAWLFVDEIIIE